MRGAFTLLAEFTRVVEQLSSQLQCGEQLANVVVVEDAEAQLYPPEEASMIRKLKSGEYRLYSRNVDARTGRRRHLGTFGTRAAAEKHERAIQFFKRHG
jgi:hypothetical protein